MEWKGGARNHISFLWFLDVIIHPLHLIPLLLFTVSFYCFFLMRKSKTHMKKFDENTAIDADQRPVIAEDCMKNVLKFDFTWKELMEKCKCVSKTSPRAAANGCETLEGVRFVRQTLDVKKKEKQSKNKTQNWKNQKQQQRQKKKLFWPCSHCYEMHFLPASSQRRQLFFNDLSLSLGVGELFNCHRQSRGDTEKPFLKITPGFH